MKLKRFLALAVSLAMVITMIPAFSLTASAATTTAEISATTDFGWNFTNNVSTEASDTVNLVVSWNDQREALMSFAIPDEILAYANQDAKITATLTTKAPHYNNGIGSAPVITIIALDGDVINNADMAGGANTSAALNEAVAAGTVLGTMDAKVTSSVDLDVTSVVKSGETNLGLLLTCHGGRGYEVYGIMQFKDPVVTFTAMSNELAAAQDAVNAVKVPVLSTKASIELPATAGEYAVTWTSDNDAVLDGNGNYTSPEAATTVMLTPSVTVGSEVVSGKAQAVVVFPASRAGSVYDSGSGIFTIGTENIVAASGTAASFEDAEGNRVLTGWTSHLGGETNGAMDWVDATVDVVPDGNWAYAGWWNDNITHNSNYCTIDTMWPVEAGKYYLSFYAKKPAGASTTYVYYSTDNAHHRNDASLTSEAWYSLVSPGSDWAKYEYIIEATEAGYIGFTSYNIGNNGNRGTQFDDFELYSAEMAATSIEVVATYTANGEQVDTATLVYDTTKGEENVTFPELYYAPNGSNTIYYAPATTLAASDEIVMTAVENPGEYAVGDVFANAGTQYEIKSANLVPNGDFAYGTTGWYNSAGGAATFFNANGDGTMTLTAGGTGVGGANSLYRAWTVESGKKYLFTFDTDTANEYHKVSVTNALATDDTSNTFLNLGGTNNGSVQGTNSVIFDATTAYVMINFRWLGTGQVYGNFGLYEIAESEVQVKEEIESVEAPADVTVFGDAAVVLPATVKVTGSLGSVVDGTVAWDAPATYPAGTTTVNGTLTVQFGDAEAITEAVSVNVTVLDEFTLSDITTVNGQTDGKNNQVLFPAAIGGAFTMEFTANYASFGDLWITIKTKDAGFFGPEQIPLGVNGNGAFRPVNGNGAGGRTTADADLAYLSTGVDYGFVVTTDASTDKYSVVIFDKATGVVVVEVNDFGYRTNADAIEAITSLTNNGAGSVTLTDIKVSAGSNVELCTITVDGEVKKVVKGYDYKHTLADGAAALVDEAGNLYAPENGVVTVPVAADMTLTSKSLGLAMVEGAQVRIGATELEDGAKLDALADSGIRFLTTVDKNETLANVSGATYGVRITAEGTDKYEDVAAVNWQTEGQVFSTALTNIAESNYNRKFTATPYVEINGTKYFGTGVTRSIYQVSAGIMKNGSADAENAPYTVDGVVKNILNAYVNQTGIRLSVSADGIAVEDGKYTGDVFFTVTSVSDGDDGWNVTITPDASWGTPAEIAAWWTDYVRFNNNNSIAKGYISDAAVDAEGVLTFNFDTTADDGGFEGEEDPLV